jgi:disulfide bond formation protein DsbB
MATLLRHFLDRWRFCALLASIAMLATAHAFETFGGLAPCLLCLKQREVYWWAAGLALGFMVLVRMPGGPRWRELTCWVLGAVFLVGMGFAIYHAGAEWKFWPGPAACSGGAKSVSAADLQAFLNNTTKLKRPSCEDAAWVFAGLSMAGWNAVASLMLAIGSVLAALRERTRR